MERGATNGAVPSQPHKPFLASAKNFLQFLTSQIK